MVKTKLTVPSKLSEITLGQYQKFAKISEKDQEEDFLQKKMIEIFCGVPLKYVDNFKYTSIKKVTTVLVQMFKEKTNLIERFKMDGVEYGFIPKLDDMSFGEYADLDQLMKDWDTMDKALAVLYRPVKKSYSGRYIIEEYDVDKTKPMAGMPLDVAFSAVFFLVNLSEELMKHTLHYSAKALKTLTPQQKQVFMTPSGGLPHSIKWLRETLQNLAE